MSVYSPSQNRNVQAIVVFDPRSSRIIIDFGKDASPYKNADEIAKSLWGPNASGTEKTTLSPDGTRLSDLVPVVMKVEESIAPPHDLSRIQELEEIRKELSEAVKERAQELNIPLDLPTDAPGGGHDR